MNLLLLTLALATTAQDAQPAPAAPAAPSQTEQALDAAVTCSSVNMVASVVVGQMGDTAQQERLRRQADNFKTASLGFGQALGVDQATVIQVIAEDSAARIAPLDAMATAPDRGAKLSAWADELNQQLTICDQFAAKLAGR